MKAKIVRESILRPKSSKEIEDSIKNMNEKEIDKYFLKKLIIKGKNDLFKYLIENKDLSIFKLERALEQCVDYNNEELLRYLADEIQKYKAGDLYRGIIEAAERGNLEYLKILEEKGGDLHTNQEEPLVTAAAAGRLDIVKYLVNQGADVNERNGLALKNAVTVIRPRIVEYLIEETDLKDEFIDDAYSQYEFKIHYDEAYREIKIIFEKYFREKNE